MEDNTKYCPRCGKSLHVDSFQKDKGAIDGFYYICRSCHSKADEARVKYEKDTSLTHKICNKCGEMLPIRLFSASSRNKDGYHSYCKYCQKIHAKDAKISQLKEEILKQKEINENLWLITKQIEHRAELMAQILDRK